MLRSSQPDHIPGCGWDMSRSFWIWIVTLFVAGKKQMEQFGLFTGNEDKEEEYANVGGITAGNGYAEEEK